MDENDTSLWNESITLEALLIRIQPLLPELHDFIEGFGDVFTELRQRNRIQDLAKPIDTLLKQVTHKRNVIKMALELYDRRLPFALDRARQDPWRDVDEEMAISSFWTKMPPYITGSVCPKEPQSRVSVKNATTVVTGFRSEVEIGKQRKHIELLGNLIIKLRAAFKLILGIVHLDVGVELSDDIPTADIEDIVDLKIMLDKTEGEMAMVAGGLHIQESLASQLKAEIAPMLLRQKVLLDQYRRILSFLSDAVRLLYMDRKQWKTTEGMIIRWVEARTG